MLQSSCRNCSASITYSPSASLGFYCSNQCQADHKNSVLIDGWLTGLSAAIDQSTGNVSKWLRRYLIAQAGAKCQECGWGEINQALGTSPLEIDHVDGDHRNNRPENLRVLCPNCHSLKPTYKALNKGSGRAARRRPQQFI